MKFNPRDARAISIGIEFVVSVLLGLGAGRWLDNRFHTTPWLTLVGIVLGSAAGFRSLLRLMRESEASAAREEKRAADDARDARERSEFREESARTKGETSGTNGASER